MQSKKRFRKIYVEITNVCNLKCKFCPETKRQKQFIEVTKFKEIIPKIKEYTNLIYLHVKGEPLLHPQLEEILKICEENNIKINLTTNGTLLRKNQDILKQSKAIRQINISVHSATQNDNIKTQDYLQSIFETVSKLNNIYISYRLWNLENTSNNQQNIQILEILAKEYNISNLIEEAKKYESIKLKENIYLNQDQQFEWPDINAQIVSKTGSCLGLRDQIAILVNGDIVPCCLDQEADIKLGNIYINTIDEILESKLSQEIIHGFQNRKLIHPLCQKCDFRKRVH